MLAATYTSSCTLKTCPRHTRPSVWCWWSWASTSAWTTQKPRLALHHPGEALGTARRGLTPEGLTLHWQRVHSVPCLIQEDPVKRTTFISSRQVLVISLRTVSAWQGSVTQRGQHSLSGRTLNSHSTSGQGRGQQSTSPCCEGKGQREWIREKRGKKGRTGEWFLYLGLLYHTSSGQL